MQTPNKTASKSSIKNGASVNQAAESAEQKKFKDDDDFDEDFDDEPLDDLDYDGVNRFDDEDDDY